MVVTLMAYPTRKISLFGYEFILGASDRIVILDNSTATVGATSYKSFETLGVDYQVPVNKKAMILGASDLIIGSAVGTFGKSTAADSGTGYVSKLPLANMWSGTNKISDLTFIAGEYLTIYNGDGVGRSLTLTYCIILESDA